ncbi:MAG: hypothetical protein R6V57_09595 [Vicinamibacterales bacterium]
MIHARTSSSDLFVAVAVTLVVLLAPMTFAQSGTPATIGTWVLNIPKSMAASADSGPTMVATAIRFEAAGAGVRCTIDLLDIEEGAQSLLNRLEFSGQYDGRDNTVEGSPLFGEVVALTRVDAHTTKSVFRQGRAVTVTMTSVVSSDGNTMTVTSTVPDANGSPVTMSVAVYDKRGEGGSPQPPAPSPYPMCFPLAV